METLKNLQIGVIGSAADLNYGKDVEAKAVEVGREIASRQYRLIFGAEKDCDSLSTAAARAARKLGGFTVGITYDKGLEVFDPEACSVVIATGMVRGGGRELVQGLSCDGVIAIAGGSGTMNETTVAYQAGIPVVCMTGLGGWSEKLAGTYLDDRQRYRFGSASTGAEALDALEVMIAERGEL